MPLTVHMHLKYALDFCLFCFKKCREQGKSYHKDGRVSTKRRAVDHIQLGEEATGSQGVTAEGWKDV